MGVTNEIVKKFGHKPMQNLAAYMLSKNCETQAVAFASADGASTGTKAMVLNGEPMICAADAAYDVSAELPYAAWAASTAYTTGGTASEVVNQLGEHFACILAHTSATTDEPGIGANWETYWKKLDKWAEAAAGEVLADAAVRHYLVCALADGTLRMFKAHADTSALKIPFFDAERYVALAIVKVTASGATTIGTTDISGMVTIMQLTGSVFPHPDNWDKN